MPANPNDSEERREAERRSADGALKVFRVVRVGNGGDEGLARCRNISDSGMKLDLSMSLTLNDYVEVTFSSSISVSGRVAWTNGRECGIAFDGKVDSSALLRASASEAHADRARPPRLRTNVPATVMVRGGNSVKTIISDISQHGMKLSHDGSFHAGLHVKVRLKSGKEIKGVVQWSKDNIAGLYLLDPFSVLDLGSVQSLNSSREDD